MTWTPNFPQLYLFRLLIKWYNGIMLYRRQCFLFVAGLKGQ